MIQLKDITKIYKNGNNDLYALKKINLEIEKGDFIAIMGASGSGKTTLLNILGCMDAATEGEYTFDGEKVSELKPSKTDLFRREHIGFVFQNFALLKDYTLRENVEIPLRALNIPKKKRNRISDDILSRVGLADYIKQYPTKISGGQQQRCAIARALVSGADLILADEPTGALDSKTGQEILDLLKKINSEGRTVIIVTHDEKIAIRANRIIKLEDGCIVG
ncbi:MAG: ABC transporter ATP-binding protein [Lachnospiraceae bacterium]|nr:ABC transporter ATP-binding protein [Lachnospiraceae bacterium]